MEGWDRSERTRMREEVKIKYDSWRGAPKGRLWCLVSKEYFDEDDRGAGYIVPQLDLEVFECLFGMEAGSSFFLGRQLSDRTPYRRTNVHQRQLCSRPHRSQGRLPQRRGRSGQPIQAPRNVILAENGSVDAEVDLAKREQTRSKAPILPFHNDVTAKQTRSEGRDEKSTVPS